MTALLRRSDPWTVQPGWGIFVDLTPPELMNARQLRTVRRAVVAGLVAVLLLLAGAYFVADRDRSSAEDELANAQLTTTQLQQQQHKYLGITEIKGTVLQIRTQIAGLMQGDVATDSLLQRIGAAAPAGVELQTVSVTISAAGVAGAQAQAGGSTIDVTTHARIGTVTLNGTASRMDAVSTFVDRLSAIAGVLDVVPTSNSQGKDGGQFTVTLGLDDQLLTHHFDVKGGK